MLTSSNFEESAHFTRQYLRQAPIGYEVMKKCGFPGVGFTGWTTLSGEFCGRRSLEDWLTSHKPMFSAYAIYSIYNEWKMNPDFNPTEYREIAEDVLKFWLHRMVVCGDDGLYYLRSVKDGAEMGIEVEVDSFTQILFAKAFSYVGEIYGIEKYSDIGAKMLRALECNRMEDGRLSAFKGSAIPLDIILHYYYIHGDELFAPEILKEDIEFKKTPFGLDNRFAVEEYRHWPWNDAWAAECFILNKMPSLAAERISHSPYGCSALGALPEKIRLDGFPIGYYYTTPHAALVISLAEAFAVMGRGDELCIAYGFSGDDVSICCRNISVGHGLSVSMIIEKSRLISLTVSNGSRKPVTISLSLNPEIEADLPTSISVSDEGNFEYSI